MSADESDVVLIPSKPPNLKTTNTLTTYKMVIKKNSKSSKNTKTKLDPKKFPTLKLKNERDIAMDFAEKVTKNLIS